MFGEYEFRIQFIKIVDKKIYFFEDKGGIVRYRCDDFEVIIKNNGEKLKVFFVLVLGYGVKFFMIKFRDFFVIFLKDVVVGFVEVFIEVDVKIGDLIIDYFIFGKEKYVFYGVIEVGVICCYQVSFFYIEELEFIGVVKFIVFNFFFEWKLFERVVVLIKGILMYYENIKVYYFLFFVMFKNYSLEVNNMGRLLKEGLNVVGKGFLLFNFLMRWQYGGCEYYFFLELGCFGEKVFFYFNYRCCCKGGFNFCGGFCNSESFQEVFVQFCQNYKICLDN